MEEIDSQSPVRTESMSSQGDKSNYFKEISDKCIWEDLMTKRDEDYKLINDYLKSQDTDVNVPPHPELSYLENNVFPILLPILEKTLKKAKRMESLKGQRNLFNGIDFVAECLWNTNVKYPERSEKPLNIFLMPWVQQYLIKKPRKIFPLSWILTKVEASVMVQNYLRGYFVRRQEDVQEMRLFWKTVRYEKNLMKPETEELM